MRRGHAHLDRLPGTANIGAALGGGPCRCCCRMSYLRSPVRPLKNTDDSIRARGGSRPHPDRRAGTRLALESKMRSDYEALRGALGIALSDVLVPGAVLKERLGLGTVRKRRERKPTLASVAKHATKAGIEVARYEVKPDGTVVVVTGKTDTEQTDDLDNWIAKHAVSGQRH